MRLAVFGATGQTGQALVPVALEHGWTVCAFVRTQAGATLPLPERLGVVHGDPGRMADIERAVRGSDAVACVFGPRLPNRRPFCAPFTRRIVDAMRTLNVRRIVCVTGAMIGPMPANTSRAMRAMAAFVRGRMPAQMADRAEQEEIVASSGLDWTLVKPPRLTGGTRTEVVHADPSLQMGILSRICRQDLAEFVFRAAAHGRFVGQRVYVRN
jgi:uncharacterized protein YbjT (DUF2867 family)